MPRFLASLSTAAIAVGFAYAAIDAPSFPGAPTPGGSTHLTQPTVQQTRPGTVDSAATAVVADAVLLRAHREWRNEQDGCFVPGNNVATLQSGGRISQMKVK